MADLEYLEEEMRAVLSRERFLHTCGVRYTACCLAMAHGADTEKAQIAGLLHDCAKNIPAKEQIAMCDEAGIALSVTERENPSLIHAKLGAHLAKERYGIPDPEILSAITYHTTGRAKMALLEEILFVADYIEPYRDTERKLPYVDEMRACAFRDLHHATFLELKATLIRIKERGSALDETTLAAYDDYKGF